MGICWLVCSGSGGVGKSTVALSLAVGAASRGKKTVLLDASGITRSCDLALGLESCVVLDMVDVLSGQAEMPAALYPVPGRENLRFACASLYNGTDIAEIAGMILALRSMCDILVVDLPTGQASLSRGMLQKGDQRLFVLRPDDACIRSTERLMALCPRDDAETSLLLNFVSKSAQRSGTQYPAQNVQMLLDCPILETIPEEPAAREIMRKGKAVIESFCAARLALGRAVGSLLNLANG